MAKHVIIIGAGIAGTVVAEQLRKLSKDLRISILDASSDEVYNKTLLSSYANSDIEKDSIFVRSKEWYVKNDIDICFNTSVDDTDLESKEIKSGDKVFTYDYLVLALGGSSRKVVENKAKVYYFNSLSDAKNIKKEIENQQKITVVGGSFASLDALLISHRHKIPSKLIIRDNTLWAKTIHPMGSKKLVETAKKFGTTIFPNVSIKEISEKDNEQIIKLSNGTEIKINFLISTIGLDTKPSWLESSGLLGDRGIMVNDHLQTKVKSIYACGDCAEYLSPTGYRLSGNWQNAVAMAHTVAKNIMGKKEKFRSLPNYQIEFHEWFVNFIGDVEPSHSDNVEDKIIDEAFVREFYQKNNLIGFSWVGKKNVPRELIDKVYY